jgi:hypothetical protein
MPRRRPRLTSAPSYVFDINQAGLASPCRRWHSFAADSPKRGPSGVAQGLWINQLAQEDGLLCPRKSGVGPRVLTCVLLPVNHTGIVHGQGYAHNGWIIQSHAAAAATPPLSFGGLVIGRIAWRRREVACDQRSLSTERCAVRDFDPAGHQDNPATLLR